MEAITITRFSSFREPLNPHAAASVKSMIPLHNASLLKGHFSSSLTFPLSMVQNIIMNERMPPHTSKDIFTYLIFHMICCSPLTHLESALCRRSSCCSPDLTILPGGCIVNIILRNPSGYDTTDTALSGSPHVPLRMSISPYLPEYAHYSNTLLDRHIIHSSFPQPECYPPQRTALSDWTRPQDR